MCQLKNANIHNCVRATMKSREKVQEKDVPKVQRMRSEEDAKELAGASRSWRQPELAPALAPELAPAGAGASRSYKRSRPTHPKSSSTGESASTPSSIRKRKAEPEEEARHRKEKKAEHDDIQKARAAAARLRKTEQNEGKPFDIWSLIRKKQ